MSNETNSEPNSHSNQYVYLNGQIVENPVESHHHVSPKALYVAVFSALLVLTAVTYLVSYANLGPASLPVAMLVASMKASLVIAFFMHLKYEDRTFAFMFATALLFVSIFFTFILYDLGASGELNEETSMEYKRSVDDAAEAIANPAPETVGDHSGGHGTASGHDAPAAGGHEAAPAKH
jgi:cytochrome c oxidase subunit 4